MSAAHVNSAIAKCAHIPLCPLFLGHIVFRRTCFVPRRDQTPRPSPLTETRCWHRGSFPIPHERVVELSLSVSACVPSKVGKGGRFDIRTPTEHLHHNGEPLAMETFSAIAAFILVRAYPNTSPWSHRWRLLGPHLPMRSPYSPSSWPLCHCVY